MPDPVYINYDDPLVIEGTVPAGVGPDGTPYYLQSPAVPSTKSNVLVLALVAGFGLWYFLELAGYERKIRRRRG